MPYPPAAPEPGARRGPWKSVLAVSVGLHAAAALVAGVVIVAKYFAPPPAAFVVKKSPAIPPRELEQKMAAAEFDAMSPKPVFDDKIASTRATDFALPDLPSIPMDSVLPLDAAAVVSEAVEGMVGSAGMGAGGDGGSGLGGAGSGMSFFGIEDKGQSVVIMIDVSDSMFTRTGDAADRSLVRRGKEQSFQRIRDEAVKLVEGLGINTRFGIVRWSGGAHPWKAELVPATDGNKAAAVQHIQEGVDFKKAPPRDGRPGGTRHDYALEEAFKLRPEVIYMLTDGNATEAVEGGGLSPIPADRILDAAEAGQKTLVQEARLHVIYYVTGSEKREERDMLDKLARKNHGKFRTIEAAGMDRKK